MEVRGSINAIGKILTYFFTIVLGAWWERLVAFSGKRDRVALIVKIQKE